MHSGPVSPVIKSAQPELTKYSNGVDNHGPNTRSSSGNELHSDQNDLNQTVSDILGHLSQESVSSNGNPNGLARNLQTIQRGSDYNLVEMQLRQEYF